MPNCQSPYLPKTTFVADLLMCHMAYVYEYVLPDWFEKILSEQNTENFT